MLTKVNTKMTESGNTRRSDLGHKSQHSHVKPEPKLFIYVDIFLVMLLHTTFVHTLWIL